MNSTMDVIVATVGKPHGLRGEVTLILRTDRPDDRLAPGEHLEVQSQDRGVPSVLTVESTRVHQGRWLVCFEQIPDRTAAEALRGSVLRAHVDAQEEAEEDPDAWYPSQLRGLTVYDSEGESLGEVVGLEHYPAQDLLVVRASTGERVMLPFVRELVPEVDIDGGRIIANPPGGLFPGRGEPEIARDAEAGDSA